MLSVRVVMIIIAHFSVVACGMVVSQPSVPLVVLALLLLVCLLVRITVVVCRF